MSELYFRQLDIWDPRKKNPTISIIGAGAIGSFTALALSKMGIKNIELIDFDRVTKHNISNQFVRLADLGKYKVDCVADICKQFSPEKVNISVQRNKFIDPETSAEIVIAATDNIESRVGVFEVVKESPLTRFYIDSRMGGELLHIFSFNPHSDKAKEYINYFTKKPAKSLPCSARAILYNVLMCASLVGNIVRKYCVQKKIPFHIIYDMSTLEQIVTWDGIDTDD